MRCWQAGTDIKNTESLQRGARNFMNYCSGCHSLKYLRYNRLGADLKIPESELPGNLMFTSDKAVRHHQFSDAEGFRSLVRQAAAGLVADGPRARRRLSVFVT